MMVQLSNIDRREFLKTSAVAAALIVLPTSVTKAEEGLTTIEVLRQIDLPRSIRGQFYRSISISFTDSGSYGGELVRYECMPGTNIVTKVFVQWHGDALYEVRDIAEICYRCQHRPDIRYVQFLPNQWRRQTVSSDYEMSKM